MTGTSIRGGDLYLARNEYSWLDFIGNIEPDVCPLLKKYCAKATDYRTGADGARSGSMRYSTVKRRTAIGIRVDGQDRRRPLHRWCEIHARTGQEFPALGQRDSEDTGGGRDEVRCGQAEHRSKLSPMRAAGGRCSEEHGTVGSNIGSEFFLKTSFKRWSPEEAPKKTLITK